MSRYTRMILPLLLASLTLAAAAQVPKDFRADVAVLQSSHSDGDLTEARVREALWYAAEDLKIDPARLPRVIVIHAGLAAAQIAGVPTTVWTSDHKSCGATVAERTEDGGKLYFLWMVGKASDVILARGVVQILQSYAGLDKVEEAAVAHRVLMHMKVVVNAEVLHAG